MDKELEIKIISYLKENLKIRLNEKPVNEFYTGLVGYDIEASIVLNNTEDIENDILISKSSISIDIK